MNCCQYYHFVYGKCYQCLFTSATIVIMIIEIINVIIMIIEIINVKMEDLACNACFSNFQCLDF